MPSDSKPLIAQAPELNVTHIDELNEHSNIQMHPHSWQALLSASSMSAAELLQKVGLAHHAQLDDTQSEFPLRVPKPYLDKIQYGDPNDPLLLQILPQKAERQRVDGFSLEPLEEQRFSPVPGLIHKYSSRVLLISTQACAIHCRYCFRRNFPYEAHKRSRSDWEQALTYISNHPEVNEVILSGGDPLSLPDRYLNEWLLRLDELSNVKRIRIHTRLLPSLPERITNQLCTTFSALKSKLILVSHCNHPNELGEDTKQAFAKLKASRVTLLNQSVLLANINDDADTLARLSERLFEQDVLPYYLFLLDKVHGAAHFDVPETQAKPLHKELAAKLPGFLLPKLAYEQPGESSKSTL